MTVSSTVSLQETIYQSWISPNFQVKARHYQNPNQFSSAWDPNIGTNRISVPRFKTNEGAPADRGAAVDDEYDADEAVAIVPVELETEESHFDLQEYGMARELSYTALEDTIAGDTLGYCQADMAQTLNTAFNDDTTAVYADASNASGTPGSDMTLEDLDDALFDLAERGAMGELTGVVSHKQVRDWHAAIQASDTDQAVFAGAADRIMAASADAQQGRNLDGKVFRYKDVDFYRSGLIDTANTAQDDVGAIYVRESNRNMSAIGKGTRRPFTMEFDRDVLKRTVILVGTMRQGTGLLQDDFIQALITKAT